MTTAKYLTWILLSKVSEVNKDTAIDNSTIDFGNCTPLDVGYMRVLSNHCVTYTQRSFTWCTRMSNKKKASVYLPLSWQQNGTNHQDRNSPIKIRFTKLNRISDRFLVPARTELSLSKQGHCNKSLVYACFLGEVGDRRRHGQTSDSRPRAWQHALLPRHLSIHNLF